MTTEPATEGKLPTTLTPGEIARSLDAILLGKMTAAEAKAEHHRINAERRR